MNDSRLIQWLVGLSFMLFLVACGPTPAVPQATEAAQVQSGAATTSEQFNDPFAYCAAVGTLVESDQRYTGPEVPEVIVEGLREAMEIADDAPSEWVAAGSTWRCMEGQPWACFVGANLPCEAQADLSQTPTAPMEEFCQTEPNSDFIPANVTGRETVYEWRCTEGSPEVVQQLFEADAQSFIADFWYQIDSP